MGTASLIYFVMTQYGTKSVQKRLQHPHCHIDKWRTLISIVPVSLEAPPVNLPVAHASMKLTHLFFVPLIKPRFHYHASVWLQDILLLVPWLLPMTAIIISWPLFHIPQPHRNCHGRCPMKDGRAWVLQLDRGAHIGSPTVLGEYTTEQLSVWLSWVLNLGEVVPSGRRFRDILYVKCFLQSPWEWGVSSYLLPGTHQLSSLHLYVLLYYHKTVCCVICTLYYSL